jgi:hypothetical protein
MKSQVDERQIRIRIQKAMQQICPILLSDRKM